MSQTHCLFVVRRVHLEMYYGAMLIRIVNYGIRLNSFVDRTATANVAPTTTHARDALGFISCYRPDG